MIIAADEADMLHEVIHVSDDLRMELMDSYIEPFYRNMVEKTLKAKVFWRQSGITMDTLSKALIAVGGILSFSTNYFEDHSGPISLVSGSVSCVSLATIQFAAYCFKEHSRQSKELNAILKRLKIETIPILNRTTSEFTDNTPPKHVNRSNDHAGIMC